ncbi:MAG: alpha/beta fold hydrolase [Thiogranum sp.]
MWNFARARPTAGEWSARHLPSAGDDSFHYNADSISAYLDAARRRVEQSRTDLGGSQDSWVIEGNSPFFLEPANAHGPSRGILMAHGLTDSPFALRDMARFFQRQGFHVLGMLLPGHGTRPGDLLQVRWQDWVRAHQHLLRLLQARVERVYAFGFSAGATLSIYQSLLNPAISGLFLFSPAIGVSASVGLARPLSRLGRRWRRLAWFDIQPDTDVFKYESLTNRAIGEVYELIQAVRHLGTISERRVPLFVAASERDVTLDSTATLRWFGRQSGVRRMLYYTTGQPRVPAFVKCVPSRFPHLRIRSFSHTSLTQSPANPHYGAHGTQRFCTHYYRFDRLKYQRCKAGEEDCLGEMFDESPDCQVIRRLTYNPLFEEMLGEIRDFLGAGVSVA